MLDGDAVVAFQTHGQDIPRLLDHWAARQPEQPVLIWCPADGEERRWTYAQLRHDVNRVAAGLTARGIVVGDRLLVHAENCPEMILTWLACAEIGAVAVTTNTRSVLDELRYFAERSQAVAAVTQPAFADLVRNAAPQLSFIAVTGGPAAGDATTAHAETPFDQLLGDAAAWPGRSPQPMLPYAIMFTSGTTSRPKAVVHTHANAIWASRTGPRTLDLGPNDAYLVYLPFFHVNAQSWSLLSVLGAGATCVLMPKWSRSRFWDVVTRHGVTHLSLMPFVVPLLTVADKPPNSLRIATFGRSLPGLPERAGVEIVTAFGMTETVTHAITAKGREGLPPYTMGRVAPGYQVAVIDKVTGELCAEDQPGELWLRGTRGIQLFLGYLNDPAADDAAFDDGWFKTGDMVSMGAGGVLTYRERDKDLLRVGGENVSAKEVEDVMLTIDGVTAAAVVGKQHDFLDQVPVAFVVTDRSVGDEAVLERNVIAACAERLAAFKVPRAVYVVDSFPTGTLDKLLKNKLRDMADAQPALD